MLHAHDYKLGMEMVRKKILLSGKRQMPNCHESSLPQSLTVLANSILISFIVSMVNQNQICCENIKDMNLNVFNRVYGYDFHLYI